MGGGESSGGAQVIQPPRQQGPLEPMLNAHSTLMLNGVGQFAPWGSGHRLVGGNFGQVNVPDPSTAYTYGGGASGGQGIGGGGSLFPSSAQQGQYGSSPPNNSLMQLLSILSPGLFNMNPQQQVPQQPPAQQQNPPQQQQSVYQQPVQANAGGQQQSSQSQQTAPQPQQQLNPQQVAMQQQWIQAIQSAGGSLPNYNPQTGAFM